MNNVICVKCGQVCKVGGSDSSNQAYGGGTCVNLELNTQEYYP